jgi:hypothetical protein
LHEKRNAHNTPFEALTRPAMLVIMPLCVWYFPPLQSALS